MRNNQQSLFDECYADSMSRDAAMERGLLVQVDGIRWVRMDRKGVSILHKKVTVDGVMTREERVSSLPFLPLCMYSHRKDYYLQALFGTITGGLRLDTVRLDVLLNPQLHDKSIHSLGIKGFVLTAEQWKTFANTLRQVISAANRDGLLTVKRANPMNWNIINGYELVERNQPLRVLPGGKID